MASLKYSMFQEVPRDGAKTILESRQLGFSQVRLLPKDAGTRPIINLRRRVSKLRNGRNVLGRSINSIMGPVQNMLNCERILQPSKLGSSLFSVGDMYPRLKTYKLRLQQLNIRRCELYFAKVDVQSCFDTIPQRNVIRLIERLASKDEYRIERHVEMKKSNIATATAVKPSRRFIAKAAAADDFYTFAEKVEQDLAPGKRNAIFVNHAAQTKQKKKALLELLRSHVAENLVKIGKKFYRQKEGIPQGSVISSLLCNFFYADLEQTSLDFLLTDDGDLLFRLVDDFLLITPRREHATSFLDIMHQGIPEYGVTVATKKSLVNFDANIKGERIPKVSDTSFFPYCGTLIDMNTLEFRKDRRQKSGTCRLHHLRMLTQGN
ncbi:MAG: hypothetical protein M1837_006552 [Sclerophora amabilis]|nr:MAG: hypothetical protein M1837_006552 [Sclerophora amabilis]